ncbi:hypothetical protein L3X38_006108 [Prunus dulcis]|uniref:MATE efflux family protein n=1 Tax=Prunus dulcis TaxID=3755 RepID=A0AAD4ZS21_PRUDU|nr:hypothetical protein L3X38_006108 [Prunus dulcis]
MKFSSACSKTRAPISKELFHGMGEFFHFAIPSALMLCLEWWSFELLILLSGLLPNPALETSVLSECYCWWTVSKPFRHYAIPYWFGAAASTRVANELGAGNPEGARLATRAAMFLAVTETNNFQGVLTGVARGIGWQHIGAYINLGAFYLCGIPVAAILAFWVHFRGIGLWIGIQVGSLVQTILLSFVTTSTNWEKQASKAREIFEGKDCAIKAEAD